MFFWIAFFYPFHVLRTYRRAAGEKRNAEANAKPGFLQQFMRYVDPAIVSKMRSKTCSEALPNPPQTTQKPPKIEPGSVHESPEAAKRRPRASKRGPRSAQGRPKSAQVTLKIAQDGPKRGPRGSQTLQNRAPRGPISQILDFCRRSASMCQRKAFQARFSIDFALVRNAHGMQSTQ